MKDKWTAFYATTSENLTTRITAVRPALAPHVARDMRLATASNEVEAALNQGTTSGEGQMMTLMLNTGRSMRPPVLPCALAAEPIAVTRARGLLARGHAGGRLSPEVVTRLRPSPDQTRRQRHYGLGDRAADLAAWSSGDEGVIAEVNYQVGDEALMKGGNETSEASWGLLLAVVCTQTQCWSRVVKPCGR
ncbi:hypothetical protein [Streptomyces sp. ME19-01-6]|uniref:hypothetical protein n=1 Tax=Streptomyces sp. ME19-01-6 TaxID=3028686 RepID=UPI0029A2CA00|nr:hypothetical protein [Streptomyces sp. ME19-01-6]MDX3224522.1 hypothetical protein [Streptomyces sp. ME19-01-6]